MFLSCHVRLQSESALYRCLNVKELLAWSRREIWSLIWSNCNWTRTQAHLVRKRTLNYLAKLTSLAKWLSVRFRTQWFWVRIQLQSNKFSLLIDAFGAVIGFFELFYPFKPRQPHKILKHTQIICRRIVWVCLSILWGWRLKG